MHSSSNTRLVPCQHSLARLGNSVCCCCCHAHLAHGTVEHLQQRLLSSRTERSCVCACQPLNYLRWRASVQQVQGVLLQNTWPTWYCCSPLCQVAAATPWHAAATFATGRPRQSLALLSVDAVPLGVDDGI